MLLYKITFIISGDKFYPNKISSLLSKTLDLVNLHYPEDNDNYEFGIMSFMHPKIFAVLGKGTEYENDFIIFFEKYQSIFIEFGALEFEFFTEVYYSGDQCNFEIFNRSLLERLHQIQKDIAFPVSVYHMKKKQLKQLLMNSDVTLN